MVLCRCSVLFTLLFVLLYRPTFAQNVTLDDSSPELVFGGGIVGNCNVGNATFCGGSDCPDPIRLLNGTWHDCGLNPAMSFSFTGTAFWIFGVVPDSPLGMPLPMNISTDGKLSNGTDISNLPPHTYNVSLGSVTGLSFGKHTVSVAGAISASAPPYLLIDYVVVDVTPPTISATISAPSGSASRTSQTSSPLSSSTNPPPSPSGSDTNNDTQSVQNSPNVGAIAGGAVAVLSLLIVAGASLALFFSSCRRRRKQGSRVDLLADPDEERSPPAEPTVRIQSMVEQDNRPVAQNPLGPIQLPPDPQDNLPPYPDRRLAASSLIPHANQDPFNPTDHAQELHPTPTTRRTNAPYIIHNRSDSFKSSSMAGAFYGKKRRKQDTLSSWAEAHRQDIPPEMERNLRKAGYHPDQDPDRISTEQWSNLGVGAFGLQILRDIYQASRPVDQKIQNSISSDV